MANPLYAAKDFTFGEFAALVQKVGGVDIARAILRGEKLIQVISPPQPEFVVDNMFVSAEQQLTNVRRWNTEYNLGFTEADFARLGPPPAAGDGFVQPALVPYSDTIESTFEMLWQIVVAQHPNKYRWSVVRSDPQHLRYLEGIKHPGKSLRWEKVGLADHWDKKNGIRPRDVRDPKTSPHAGILAAAAHFPKWVQTMDGETVPFVWLPGYELNVPGYGEWTLVPRLHWIAGSRRVGLSAGGAGFRSGYWAVPSLQEPACRQAD